MRESQQNAHMFDQFLKKLEVTKQQKTNQQTSSSSLHETSRYYKHTDSSDTSTLDSRNETFLSVARQYTDNDNDIEEDIARTSSSTDHNNSQLVDSEQQQQQQQNNQLFETRQSLVDRQQLVGSSHPTLLNEARTTSVDSFIERSKSGSDQAAGQDGLLQLGPDEDCLPDAILKLDRRQAIPTPRHKNDVLVEIEASTVDRRDLMIRPGVRCTQSLPQGVETIGMDCIGRVVQLTTHTRAIFGISIGDRVAAIYPFEYKDGYKDKGLRNNRYALVDASMIVTVPKHVDAAEAACMVRLHLSAFQSIAMGCDVFQNRYGFNQLHGQSILIQNGNTDLGRVLIELSSLLGASQIFATGPTECHAALKEMGAIPLGDQTFSWELFLEEKISLILVQEMPTPDNFEQYISILDEGRGNMVYIHHGHKIPEDESLGVSIDDTSCANFSEKFQNAITSAKFSVRLSCSPKYLIYEGVWRSCKEAPNQFKEDLRYLLTLLGQGSLKPCVNECINLEEMTEVQDRIELLGKKGTIVCLPTALYEKKAYDYQVVSPDGINKRDQHGFPLWEGGDDCDDEDEEESYTYASDAGYVKAPPSPSDTLSDFHSMRSTSTQPMPRSSSDNLQALPEASSFTQQSENNFNHEPNIVDLLMHPMSDPSSRGQDETSSLISSVGQNSATNASTGHQTALSANKPNEEDGGDLPLSIQFGRKKNKGRSRRYQAYQNQLRQKRAKESWKRLQQQEPSAAENTKDGNERHPSDELESCASQDSKSVITTATAGSTKSSRRLRRQARKQKGKQSETVETAIKPLDVKPVVGDIVVRKRGKVKGLTAEEVKEEDKLKLKGYNYASQRKVGELRLQSNKRSDNSDTRNENEDEGTRDSPASAPPSSFKSIMNKWKQIEDGGMRLD